LCVLKREKLETKKKKKQGWKSEMDDSSLRAEQQAQRTLTLFLSL